MQKIATLFLLCTLSFFSARAQNCGTDLVNPSVLDYDIFEMARHQPDFRGDEKDKIGVTIFIVEATTGARGLEIETIEKELNRVNGIFARAGVQFFLCGSHRIISGNARYNFNSGDALNASKRIPNTLNIYYVDEVGDGTGNDLCGYAQFPWTGSPKDRYIMMSKGCSDNGATLAHEIGHFFGLLHTHETATGVELVDGSNCERAGDLICDTPADPTLGSSNVASGCQYVGTEKDPNGVSYRPLPNNMMSYAPSTCRSFFTPGQAEVIRFFNETENDYLIDDCSFYPDFAISTTQNELSLSSGQRFDFQLQLERFNLEEAREVEIKFYVSENPEGRDFIIHSERINIAPGNGSRTLDFTLELPIFLGTGNYYLIAYIDAEFEVIELEEKNNLLVVPYTIDNSTLGEATVFPNPATDFVKLFISDKGLTRDARIEYYNVAGQLLRYEKTYKQRTEFIRLLDISDLPKGVLIISVFFTKEDERVSFKVLKE